MIKTEAILLTKDNLSDVTATLADYSVEDLREEADLLYPIEEGVVLVTSLFDDGMRLGSYIVGKGLYMINNDNFDQLNDKTYTPVSPI